MQTQLFLISLIIFLPFLVVNATKLQRNQRNRIQSKVSDALSEGCVRAWAGYIGDTTWGTPPVLCQDVPSLDQYQLSNTISSVEVGPNTKVVLFSAANYGGASFVLNATDNFVKLQQFNDRAVSLRIRSINLKQGCIVVWGGYIDDYTNPSAQICQNTPDLRPLGIDKQISSIQVGPNTQATLWNNYNYNGQSFVMIQDDNFVKLQSFNDQTSSIAITSTSPTSSTSNALNEGCVRTWAGYINDTTWGTPPIFCQDIPSLDQYQLSNTISSVEVGPNTKVILFSAYNYGGSSFVLTATDNFVKLQQFNDITKSLRIRSINLKQGCIIVWGGYIDDYTNPSAQICQNTPDLRPLGIDKQISSIQLGPNTQATLWSDYNYKGTSFVMTQDDNFVKLQNFNDQTSSIAITSGAAPTVQNVVLKGTVVYATTGGLIPDSVISSNHLSIVFNSSTGSTYNAQIVSGSKYTVTLPANSYTRTSSLNGYITTVETVDGSTSSNETNSGNTVMFAPVFEGWRFVLSWTHKYDLDSYLKTPTGLVYYQNKASSDGLSKLDLDSRNSSNPETIQTNVKTGNISYYVKSYAGGAISQSGAQVLVYHGSTQVNTYRVPINSDDVAMIWSIFQINADTQTLSEINVLTKVQP